ncbi:DUF3983 domain-containing protein (plasmid) [Bacillus mycoides]|nr:DUF3983 domain-containing protein [Bacillus mycoides]
MKTLKKRKVRKVSARRTKAVEKHCCMSWHYKVNEK